jgi:hypothetical protein
MRFANVALGFWLFAVLLAYVGALKFTGIIADFAMLTVVLMIVGMIWKYALRPFTRFRRRQL